MSVYRIPDHASPEAVIALGCAFPAVLQGFDPLRLTSVPDSVVIQGAGPIGLAAVLVAKHFGVQTIIVIDQHTNRLAAAGELGATTTLSLAANAEERKQQVPSLCGPRGPRIVIEATGVVTAFGEGIDLAGHNGHYLILGLWSGIGTAAIDPTVIVHKNLQIVGSCYAQPEHYYRAMRLVGQLEHKIPLKRIITRAFDVTEANEALDCVEQGKVIKAVIKPALGR